LIAIPRIPSQRTLKMPKAKTPTETPDKTSEPPAVDDKQMAPDKKGGPHEAALTPEAAHAVNALPATERARKAATIQRAVGNARLASLMAGGEVSATEQSNKKGQGEEEMQSNPQPAPDEKEKA
jgi:hypothetical protein